MKRKGHNIKKSIVLFSVLLTIGLMAGCGEGTKEHVKTGEERAMEYKDKAQDAVDEMNEDTKNLIQNQEEADQE